MNTSIFSQKVMAHSFSGLLLLLFLVPTFFTKELNSFQTNDLIAYLQVIFSLIFFKTTLKSIIRFSKKNLRMSVFLIALLVFYFPSSRWLNYASALLFFFTLIQLFQTNEFISKTLELKNISIIGITGYFLSPDSIELTQMLIDHAMPLYRNLRHFNYELFFAFSISCFLIIHYQNQMQKVTISIALVAFSFFH